MKKTTLVPVYDNDNNIISRVNYNENLDYWDGSNWTCGSAERHLGITRLRDGRYVLIHGTQWQGESPTAEVVTDQEALNAILRTGHDEMLDNDPRFRPLKRLLGSDAAEDEIGEDIIEITTSKPLRASGTSSYSITISPSEVDALGATLGDILELTIRRIGLPRGDGK